MFTGIVQELATLDMVTPEAGGARLRVNAPVTAPRLSTGASVAVNGCCLTVTDHGNDWWETQAVIETLDRTMLGDLVAGDRLNLERPVRVGDTLDGHVVSGHVDGVGTVTERRAEPDGSTRLAIRIPEELGRYVVEKGSVAVDGVSLTVTDVSDADSTFGVAVIPHTADVTTLGGRVAGDRVNLEVDLMAKYIERLLDRSEN